MRSFIIVPTLLAIVTQAVNVVISNDDGFAEINVRSLYSSLTSAGFSCVLSAPADNFSGTSSLDFPAGKTLKPCEFNTCPTGSPPEGLGTNNTDPRINYVNSFPVTAIKYGISTLGPKFFGGKPDLAVTGFNVGSNLGLTTLFSGTVGAATEAAKQGIPAVAFSGATGTQTAYNAPIENYVVVYTGLATKIVQALVNSGAPYLPQGTYLNVNFPASDSSTCASVSDFKFVLSRVTGAIIFTPPDVETCGTKRLPKEEDVVKHAGCYVSVSVGSASSKLDASATEQQVVLNKLTSLFSCLPQ